MMTEVRGASNAKAKRELGWQPGTQAGAQGSRRDLGRAAARRAPAGGVRDRLPDARQRRRGRGRGPGGAAARPRALEDGERIESPRAYVATITTRLAIDELRSARARRERYVGEWLPEPIVTDDGDDPARHAEMADSLSIAMLVLLESLSPEQRAVLLLRDVFDYGYGEIARIVGKSEDNVRQLAARARRHVEERRPRFETSREQRDELARRFFAAAQEGDLGGLEALLAHDVVLHRRRRRQGAGAGPVASRPQPGRPHTARLGARAPDPRGVDPAGRGQRGARSAPARRTGA